MAPIDLTDCYLIGLSVFRDLEEEVPQELPSCQVHKVGYPPTPRNNVWCRYSLPLEHIAEKREVKREGEIHDVACIVGF